MSIENQQLSLFDKLRSFSKKHSTKASAKTSKKTQGDAAERHALTFLQMQHLVLIDKNFSTKAGEVDLIMHEKKDPDTLIFIEVRFRKNKKFGGAAASVTSHKQQRIIKAALAYQQQNAPQSSMRFDVVAIEGDNINQNNSDNENIEWIKSAFDGF